MINVYKRGVLYTDHGEMYIKLVFMEKGEKVKKVSKYCFGVIIINTAGGCPLAWGVKKGWPAMSCYRLV